MPCMSKLSERRGTDRTALAYAAKALKSGH
jgi:hypothetical protein